MKILKNEHDLSEEEFILCQKLYKEFLDTKESIDVSEFPLNRCFNGLGEKWLIAIAALLNVIVYDEASPAHFNSEVTEYIRSIGAMAEFNIHDKAVEFIKKYNEDLANDLDRHLDKFSLL